MHLQEPPLCRWSFQLSFCSLFPLYVPHKQQRHFQKGLSRVGGLDRLRNPGLALSGAVLKSAHGAHCVLWDLLNFKPRQDFQFNLLLLKVPTRKTDCGKEEARRDANYVLYSFCLLIKGYTARIKETKLSRSIFLLCSINWMVVPFKRRKGIISSNHYLLSST